METESLSYKDIMAMFAESAKQIAETDKQIAELRAWQAESAKRWEALQAESAKRLEAERAEAAKKSEEEWAKSRADWEETKRVLKAAGIELNGISKSNGRAAESMVYDFFEGRMMFAGTAFDEIQWGINRKKKLPNGNKIEGEYDIVLYNGSAIGLIEAKYRVRLEDLDRLINEQLPRFKELFPQFGDFKFYLGLGGMSFDDGVEKEALRRGVGTLKLGGGAVEIDEKNVKAW